METSDNFARRLGFLLMCACLLMLFGYQIAASPFWKYGDYSFLCLTGGCGLLVGFTARGSFRLLGGFMLAASIVLGYQTFGSRRKHSEMMDRRHKAAESRILEELKKEASPVPEDGVR